MSHADLVDAIVRGDVEAALACLQSDVSLCTDTDEPSALMQALYRSQMAVAERIAQRRSNLNLFEAAAMGSREALDSHIKRDPLWHLRFAEDGFSALHLACFFGQVEAVRQLLGAGADPDAAARNRTRVHPLHSAAAARAREICALLLDRGADPDATQHGGFTALHAAARHGDKELVELLIAAGAQTDLRTRDGRDAAAFSEEGGHTALAQRLAPGASG